MSFWKWLLAFIRRPNPTPPPVPPPSPKLRPIGIFTEANAEVKLDSVGTGRTNADGYYCWPEVDAALSECHVWVTAVGFVPYDHHITLTPEQVGQDIFVGKTRWDGPHPYDIYLPPLTPEFPLPKSRDAMKRVMTNFLNLRDSRNVPQFTAFIGGYPPARQNEWIQNEINAGSTHLVCATDVNGYNNMEDSDFRKVDFYHENKWQEFADLLTRIIKKGLTPIVFLHSGDSYPGDEHFTGICDWWNTNLAKFTEYCIFVCGWETRRFGGYSANEFNRCNLIMRDKLGPIGKAMLAFHGSPETGVFGSHASRNNVPKDEHGCELDDPWYHAGEPDNWHMTVGVHGERVCGTEFEVFLYQSAVARDNEVDEFGQPQWWDRCLDTCERFLPQGTPMPGAVGVKMRGRDGEVTTRDGYAGGPKSAVWFPANDGPALCLFEVVAYDYIRGNCSAERVKEVARKAQSFGFPYFGNGLP